MNRNEPEFNTYADSYKKLLDDPIRSAFATDGCSFFHVRKKEMLLETLRNLNLDPSKMNWLDLGCGQGDLLTLLSPEFEQSKGCDPSEGMMQNIAGFEVVHQPDPQRIPFPDKSFDLVTAVCVYHHVPVAFRGALTREVRRVLKPNGILAIIEHNPWNPVTSLIVKRSPVDTDAILLRPKETITLLKDQQLTPLPVQYFLYFSEKLFRGPLVHLESAMKSLPLGGQYIAYGVNSAAGD